MVTLLNWINFNCVNNHLFFFHFEQEQKKTIQFAPSTKIRKESLTFWLFQGPEITPLWGFQAPEVRKKPFWSWNYIHGQGMGHSTILSNYYKKSALNDYINSL